MFTGNENLSTQPSDKADKQLLKESNSLKNKILQSSKNLVNQIGLNFEFESNAQKPKKKNTRTNVAYIYYFLL